MRDQSKRRTHISILALVERVKHRARSSSSIQFIPYGSADEDGFEDMPRRVPDTSKIHNLIGWRSSHSLDETIDDVLAYEQRTASQAFASS